MPMLLNKISIARYSTGVTQEFLQNILARAQEATAKKSAAVQKSSTRTSWKNDKKLGQRTGRGKFNGNTRNRGNQEERLADTLSSRTKPTFNNSIVNKQPQFKKRSSADAKTPDLDNELISAFQNRSSAARAGGNKKTTNVNNKRTFKNRDVSRQGKKNRDGQTSLDYSPVPTRVTQEDYIPQEPTPLSLLKFFPCLPNTPSSRMVNYSLDVMRSANFPLFRRVNHGFIAHKQDVPKSNSYSLKTPYFGEYIPASSLVFNKESLFKNLTLNENKSLFDSAVLGKYQELNVLGKNDFKKITKSEKKREDMEFNANIARRSIECNILDPKIKENTYQICSGLRPMSEL